jgi:tRNA pseudouridine synthase 10
VSVCNLQLTSRRVLAAMKEGESEKRKHYQAVCWAARPLSAADKLLLNSVTDMTIEQETPVRVLHRRAPLVRSRVCFTVVQAGFM